MNKTKTVFLGGSCGSSKWREELIPLLKIDYFNPVVENWTPECQAAEINARNNSDYVLYVISPKTSAVYSVAEVVDDSNKRPEKTIFCVLNEDEDFRFEGHQIKALNAVSRMVSENGATVRCCLSEVAEYLNNA